MSSSPFSALCRAALATAVALLAAAPAAADAVRWSHLDDAASARPASGLSGSVAGSNVKSTDALAPESWWGNDSSWNRYSYVQNNPIMFVDPNGEARFVILVGEPGLGRHNTGPNFNRAAETRAAELQAAGHTADVVPVGTVTEMNAAIASGDTIDGGVAYFGHSWEGTLYVGEDPLPDTNLDSSNIGSLSGANLGPDATIELNGCMTAAGGDASIAQQVADQLGRETTGWTTPISFTGTPSERLNGPAAQPPATGPLYVVPDPGGLLIPFPPRTP